MTKQVKKALEQVNQDRRKFLGMLLAGATITPMLTSTALAATGADDTSKLKASSAPLKSNTAPLKANAAPLKTNVPASKVVKPPVTSVAPTTGSTTDNKNVKGKTAVAPHSN